MQNKKNMSNLELQIFYQKKDILFKKNIVTLKILAGNRYSL